MDVIATFTMVDGRSRVDGRSLWTQRDATRTARDACARAVAFVHAALACPGYRPVAPPIVPPIAYRPVDRIPAGPSRSIPAIPVVIPGRLAAWPSSGPAGAWPAWPYRRTGSVINGLDVNGFVNHVNHHPAITESTVPDRRTADGMRRRTATLDARPRRAPPDGIRHGPGPRPARPS